LNNSRHESDDSFANALYAVIKIAPYNGVNASYLIESVHKSLDRKIKRIKRLQDKTVDHEAIIQGLNSIGLGIVSSCITYYLYKNHYHTSKLKLYKKNDISFMPLYLSTVIPFIAFTYGISNILCGLYPHYDDEYLEKYDRMLEITKAIQKNHTLKVAN
jgi:hypothetical protein